MQNFTLSYIITTKNKFSFLKICLNQLMLNLQKDEEIIIVDAGSTDGTIEFLNNLFQEGKIHRFITESDCGEGHGFNKGILLANGDLIKVITDDDYFNFPAIQECKKIMLENKNIDVMIGNVCSLELDNFNSIYLEEKVEAEYKNYLLNGDPFAFTGLSLMIRQKSIPLTGLFNSNIVCVDTEFALRITEIGVKIAWSSSVVAIRIGNSKSKMNNMSNEAKQLELDRFQYFYDHKYRKRINNLLFTILRKFKTLFKNTKKLFKVSSNQGSDLKNIYCTIEHIESVNKKCGEYILNLNKKKSNFIFSK